jgi:hypothetical protein
MPDAGSGRSPFFLEFLDIVGRMSELRGSGCSGWLTVEVEILESVGVTSAL